MIPTVILCCILSIVQAQMQDTLLFPEDVSASFWDDLDRGAKLRVQGVWKEDELYLCHDMSLNMGFLTFYSSVDFSRSEMEMGSLSFEAEQGMFSAGYGRGYIHLGQGYILGQTMMGISSDPIRNADRGKNRFRVNNKDYNKQTAFLGISTSDYSAHIFQYDTLAGLTASMDRKNLLLGTALYGTQAPLMEIWFCYDKNALRCSGNISADSRGFNFFSAHVLKREKTLALHMGGCITGGNYTGLDPDSQWGTGMGANSRGLVCGFSFKRSALKVETSAYLLITPELTKFRQYTTLKWKNDHSLCALSYRFSSEDTWEKVAEFPYALSEEVSSWQLLKYLFRYEWNSKLFTDFQIQSELFQRSAWSILIKSNYCHSNILRIQAQICRAMSGNQPLYILRPAVYSGCLIQRIPMETVLYADLVLKIKLSKTTLGIAGSYPAAGRVSLMHSL